MGVRTNWPAWRACLTAATNSFSWLSILYTTKWVSMYGATCAATPLSTAEADLGHLMALSAKMGKALAVSMMAAFSRSITAKNGGMCSPCLRASRT